MGKEETTMGQLVREAGYAQRSLSGNLLMETYGKAKMARQLGAISRQEFREISHMTVYFMNTHARELECGEKTAENKEAVMEDKREIIVLLKHLLKATRAGRYIEEMTLNEKQDRVVVSFDRGQTKEVDITADSGIAIIKDVVAVL